MSSLFALVNKNPPEGKSLVVTVLTHIEDGREMRDNGCFVVAPGATKDFLVAAGESFRVDEEGEAA